MVYAARARLKLVARNAFVRQAAERKIAGNQRVSATRVVDERASMTDVCL